MKHIKLTQEAYLDGYDGAFYRFNNEEGDALSTGLWDYWYKARAKDDDGEVSTHSRPKAAGAMPNKRVGTLVFQLTAARRRLAVNQ